MLTLLCGVRSTQLGRLLADSSSLELETAELAKIRRHIQVCLPYCLLTSNLKTLATTWYRFLLNNDHLEIQQIRSLTLCVPDACLSLWSATFGCNMVTRGSLYINNNFAIRVLHSPVITLNPISFLFQGTSWQFSNLCSQKFRCNLVLKPHQLKVLEVISMSRKLFTVYSDYWGSAEKTCYTRDDLAPSALKLFLTPTKPRLHPV